MISKRLQNFSKICFKIDHSNKLETIFSKKILNDFKIIKKVYLTKSEKTLKLTGETSHIFK
jgi:hypothetical protein